MNKSIFSKTSIALCVASTFLLTACGSEDQDKGIVSDSELVFGGRAIDGHIARATVYLDRNNNSTRDPWESFAFTDDDGYYSFNPKTNTDYCAPEASDQEKTYCLKAKVGASISNVVVRVDGGYDVTTGEPFIGQMSRRVSTDENQDGTTDVLISPLTSLLTNISDDDNDDDIRNVLASLGLERSDLDVDYLDTDGSGAIDTALFNTSLKIHKTVAVLSDRLTDTYDEIGNEVGTPNDASSIVYSSLAEQFADSGTDFNTSLSSSSVLVDVLNASEAALQDVYSRRDFDLPSNLGINFEESKARIANIVPQITTSIDRLVPNLPSDFDISVNGAAKTVEALVVKAVNEGEREDNSIDAMSNYLEQANISLINTLLDTMSQDGADVTTLVNLDFGGEDLNSEQGIIAATGVQEGLQPFTIVGGKALKISDLDLGTLPTDGRDTEVEFYFDGDSNNIDGSFTACLKYIDGANTNTGELGEGNTKGHIVFGYWSMLGASSSNQQSYSLLLTLEFLGATYQAIIKPDANQIVNDTDYSVVRFDFDGDFERFHSEEFLQTGIAVPNTNAQCEERLPSRIGL